MPTSKEFNDKVRKWDDSDKKYPIRFYKKKSKMIFEQAEEWGISPDLTRQITNSNLREIVHDAEVVIKNNDRTRLKLLIELASDLTTT